jgi:mannose-6-phosphate isomerase-like protein (cupin superfamily)
MRNAQVNAVTPTMESEAQSISHEDKSDWLQTRPGERCRIRMSAADTNGAYSVVEIVSDARDGTPMHIHHIEDEHFIILEGTTRIASGGKTFLTPQRVRLSPSARASPMPGAIFPVLRSAWW